jgi:UDP-2,3-diacylglucosamine hydrolase
VDAATMPLVPRMMAALQVGDDAALRTVLGFFEEAGFAVRAAQEIVPEVLPPEGVLTRASQGRRPSATWRAPCRPMPRWARPISGRRSSSRKVHGDRGRGAAGDGLDARLAPRGRAAADGRASSTLVAADMFGGGVAALPCRDPSLPPGGVLYKAPKPGQDLRADLPAIGPETVTGAAAAGLEGIVIAAGGVMVLDRAATVAAADAAGLFLWVRRA